MLGLYEITDPAPSLPSTCLSNSTEPPARDLPLRAAGKANDMTADRDES